jgi:cytolysin-activating lysine-acyltransferase
MDINADASEIAMNKPGENGSKPGGTSPGTGGGARPKSGAAQAGAPQVGADPQLARDVPDAAGKTVAAILGEIVWLMSQSAEFKHYLIADLEWLVMPPILLRQFRLFYHEGKPVAVVLYAFVSEEVEQRLDAGAPTLRPGDWKSGERGRIVKTIALFGDAHKFAAETRNVLGLVD